MSRVLTYSKTVDVTDKAIGSLDGEVIISPPLKMNPNRIQAIRLIQLSITSNIPNIYKDTTSGFDNTTLRVSKDDGANWDVIELTQGIYTIPLLSMAINHALAELEYVTDADETLLCPLRYNSATYECYVDITSTELKDYVEGMQFCIDFSNNNTSTLYDLIGFTTTKSFDSDGIHTADSYAKVDLWGNSILCNLNLGSPLLVVNGSQTNQLCRIPMSGSGGSITSNEYTYPNNFVSPWIIITSRSELTRFSVTFTGSRDPTKQLLFTEGEVDLRFQIREY